MPTWISDASRPATWRTCDACSAQQPCGPAVDVQQIVVGLEVQLAGHHRVERSRRSIAVYCQTLPVVPARRPTWKQSAYPATSDSRLMPRDRPWRRRTRQTPLGLMTMPPQGRDNAPAGPDRLAA